MDLPQNDELAVRILATGSGKKRGPMGKRILMGVFFCLWLQTSLLAGRAISQEVVKVGVIPFSLYAADREKSQTWPREVARMLSQDLAKDERILLVEENQIQEALGKLGQEELDEGTVREMGRKVDADYMVFGFITQANGSASLDARIIDVHQPGGGILGFCRRESAGRPVPNHCQAESGSE